MTQVPHCWRWQALAFPRESSPVPPGFPQTTCLGHKKVAGLSLQENKHGPEGRPTALRPEGSQEDRTAHRKAWPQRTVSTPPGSLQSHYPKGERRKQPVAGGHNQSLWTRSQRMEEAPVPKYLPRGAGGTLCGGGGEQLLCACPQEAQGEWPEMH